MEHHQLSKSTFIRGLQCKKSLYLHKKRPFLRDKLSAEQQAKFNRGTRIGELARDLFPGGVNMAPKSPSQAQQAVLKTQNAIDEGKPIIYEASFQYDRVLVIMDVLQQKGGNFYAWEVKSSRKISETYLTDAALQYYVITNAGIELEDIFVIYINPDYEFDGNLDLEKLFTYKSVKESILEKQETIADEIEKSKETLKLEKSPVIDIGPHCYDPYPCDFIGHCWKHIKKGSVFEFLHMDRASKFKLYSKDKTYISGLKPEELSEAGKIEYYGHTEGQRYYNREKIHQFRFASKDQYYLIKVIFIRLVIPHFRYTKPYQLLPAAVIAKDQNNEEVFNWVLDPANGNFGELENFMNEVKQQKTPVFTFENDPEQQKYLDELIGEQLYNFFRLFSELFFFDARLAGNLSPGNIAEVLLQHNPFDNKELKSIPDDKVASIQLNHLLFVNENGNKSRNTEKVQYFLSCFLDFEKLLINHIEGII